MTSSELHRKLLYRGYKDMSDYTNNNPVNCRMLELVQNLCAKYPINVEVLMLFNEIYYQCVRIQYDGNPGIGIYKRYFVEAEGWLYSRSAAELVFCMVWALYQRKRKIRPNEEVTLWKIASLIENSEMKVAAQKFVDYMERGGHSSPRLFATMPIKVSWIPKHLYHSPMTLKEKVFSLLNLPVKSTDMNVNPWRDITDNYSDKVIRFYIALYDDRQSQLGLLRRIANACTQEEYRWHKDSFQQLKKDIRNGYYNFKKSDSYYFHDYWYDCRDDWVITPRMVWIDQRMMREGLNCGRGKYEDEKHDPTIYYESVILNDLETNAKQLFKEFDLARIENPELLSLIGELLAAMTYCSGYSRKDFILRKGIISNLQDDRDIAYSVTRSLRHTKLNVEVDSVGNVTTTAKDRPETWIKPLSYVEPGPDKEEKPVTVEANDGKTVYVIQNLNIYLTAEVVQQLNLNPNEVINHIHGQIKDEINKIEVQNNNTQDQVQAQFEKLVKAKVKPENVNLEL